MDGDFLQLIQYWVTDNFITISCGLIFLCFIGIILFFIVIYRLNKLSKQYKKMMTGIENKNLEEIILTNADQLLITSQKLLEIEKRNEILDREVNTCLKKVGIVRYNAFENMGGDLSFSVALLDNRTTGFIISSIHGRDDSRTYIKPISEGKSKHNLSKEENQAIQRALGFIN